MAWTCEQIEERLSDYVDDLLSPAERSEFAAHVESCARCAPLVAQVSGVLAGMRRLEPVPAPAELIARILDGTLGPPKVKEPWFDWLAPLWQPRFALGVATVIITFSIVFHSLGVQFGRPTLADLNPITVYRSANRQAHLVYARGIKFVNDLRLVYEIQSRLRPAQAPESETVPATPPGQTPPKKPAGQVNRGFPVKTYAAMLACVLAPPGERSPR